MANPLQQNFVTLLSQKVSRKTVLNVLGILSSMVRTAKSWGYCTQAITTSELALPADELKKLTRFFNGMKRRIIMLAVVSAQSPVGLSEEQEAMLTPTPT
jgi:hypothetical protein